MLAQKWQTWTQFRAINQHFINFYACFGAIIHEFIFAFLATTWTACPRQRFFFLENYIFVLIRCIYGAVYLQSVTYSFLDLIPCLSVSIPRLAGGTLTFPWYLSLKQMTGECGHCSSDPVLTYCILTQMSGFALLTSLCSCYPSNLPKLNLRPWRQEYSCEDSKEVKKNKKGGGGENTHQAQSRAQSHTWIGQTDGINSKDNVAGRKTHCWMPMGLIQKLWVISVPYPHPQRDLFLSFINVVLEIWHSFPAGIWLPGNIPPGHFSEK